MLLPSFAESQLQVRSTDNVDLPRANAVAKGTSTHYFTGSSNILLWMEAERQQLKQHVNTTI